MSELCASLGAGSGLPLWCRAGGGGVAVAAAGPAAVSGLAGRAGLVMEAKKMNLPRGPENLCFDKDEFMKVGVRGVPRGPPGCGGEDSSGGERGPKPWSGSLPPATASSPGRAPLSVSLKGRLGR